MDGHSIELLLIEQLNELYSALSPSRLVVLFDYVEEHILRFLVTHLTNKGRESEETSVHPEMYIATSSKTFRVSIAPDLFDPSILHLAVAPVGLQEELEKPSQVQVQLSSVGRYRAVQLYVPSDAPLTVEDIAKDVQTIMTAGYGWMLEKFRDEIRRTEKLCERELVP